MRLSAFFFLAAAALAPCIQPVFLDAQSPIKDLDYSAVDPLKLPEQLYLGEVAGVATDSKGNIFVYTRTGTTAATVGGSRTFTRGGSRLYEFGPNGKFLREIGHGLYGFSFAQAVRIDPRDNAWVVDEGSNSIIKFNPEGRVEMILGRKQESIQVPSAGGEIPFPRVSGPKGSGVKGDNFNHPTDVAWDAAGNIFVSDAFVNSRVAKFDKNGEFLSTWGQTGTGPGQFDTPHSIAVDVHGDVYVADVNNHRIQVFDNDGKFKTQLTGVGAPAALCISPGAHQYLYSSNSNPSGTMDNGEIYQMELDGKIVGKFGRAGTQANEFGMVNEIDCRNPTELFVGELANWRVQKVALRGKR
jgi:DNA-binding beta-propeller fold protein YncE